MTKEKNQQETDKSTRYLVRMVNLPEGICDTAPVLLTKRQSEKVELIFDWFDIEHYILEVK